jgi:hypothetical protein
MSRGLGVEVRCTDGGDVDGMWDFEFTLPDGSLGVGEMTRITDRDLQEWKAVLEGRRPQIDSPLVWIVRPRGKRPRIGAFLEHLAEVAPHAEAVADLPDLDELADHPLLADVPGMQWIRAQQLDVSTARPLTEERAGLVIPLDPMMIEFTHATLEPALSWIEDELKNEPRYAAKIRKLARSGRPEQHLVLRLDAGGMPAAEWLSFDRDSDLPRRSPVLPVGITGLWLLPEFAREFVWWTYRDGWQRMNA